MRKFILPSYKAVMNQDHKIPLSVLIPTKDESRNIKACIESLDWADEIIVLDSLSTDDTVDIARALGIRVVERRFDDFATHKNWAFDNIDFRNDWILLVDADERATERLAGEIGEIIGRADAAQGYYVPILVLMWDRPIHCHYPVYNLRFLRRGAGRYENRIVHEHMIIEGEVGYLRNHLINRDEKGFERYVDRHNVYSSFEAIEAHRLLLGRSDDGKLDASLDAVGPRRNRMLKNFAYRYLPARPLFMFLWFYIFKRGFLGGRVGLRYCVLRAFYEYQVGLKLIELRDPDSAMAAKYRAFIER